MRLYLMFLSELDRREGYHDHLDNVNASGKMMRLHCAHVVTEKGSHGGHIYPIGIPDVHLGGANFTFMDGHGATCSVAPNHDWWYTTADTSAIQEKGCTVSGPRGDNVFTSRPNMHVVNFVTAAQWWAVAWYRNLMNCDPTGP